MCGIAGIFHFNASVSVPPELLKQMNDKQQHRGPNDEGYHFANGLGLAHRRLSIIDLEGGHQPLHSNDGKVTVVFNGEIYNYRTLMDELTELGYQFQTHSDTEVIVYAWLAWGEQCLHKFRGMFAFALWDDSKKQLFIARDRLGIKPLHYSLLADGSLIFGSELKVLRAHPACPHTLNDQAIEDYLTFGYVPDPKTIYKGVHKLPAGHYLLLQQGAGSQSITPVEYWDLPLQVQQQNAVDHQQLIEQLKQAVDLRMIADVPLGAFLSGGVDSSAIVAMMAQLQQQPVTTCAIGFDVDKFNETDYAQMVASRYNTDHHVEMINHENFDLIDKLTAIYDEPYADSSALPTYRVCELARKHVTVALSGDGGDELFAGYRRYRLHMAEQKVRDNLPAWLRKSVFKPLGKIYPKLDWAPQWLRAKTTFQSLAMESHEAYLNSMSKLRQDERQQLYSAEFKSRLKGYSSSQVFNDVLDGKHFDDKLKEAQYLDYKTWVTGDIHTKVDRASMAHALEVRVPIFDHKFVEWAFTLSSAENLVKGEGKASFKKALEPHVPEDNLYRTKMGFSIPLAQWLRGPLKAKLESIIQSPALAQSGIFDNKQLTRLYREHTSGSKNHADALWTIMMLGQFLQQEMA